jgi:hypothetical protein
MKPIITGHGTSSPARTFWILPGLFCIAIGAIIIFGYIQLNSNVIHIANRRFFSGFLLYPGIIITFAGIFEMILRIKNINRSYVFVYDSHVDGNGVTNIFMYSPVNFKLSYDQITGVETTKGSITIRAHGAKYKCYVGNPTNVQGAIFKQREQQ